MLDFSFPILFMNIIFSDIFQLFLSNNWNNWSREYYTFIKFVLFIYTCTLEFLLLELLRSMLKICNKKKLALIILHFKININFINLQSWSTTLKFRIFPQSQAYLPRTTNFNAITFSDTIFKLLFKFDRTRPELDIVE